MSGRERLMAEELVKHRIPVKYFSDMAARTALKKADIVLMGGDEIESNGKICSNIGSELIADIAEKYDIPVYICIDSWKFNNSKKENNELRPRKELWSNPPKGISVINFDYEKINPILISGIITERGIYKPHHLISELKRQYPWIHKK